MTEHEDVDGEFISYEALMDLPVLTLAWLYATLQHRGFDWTAGDA